MVGDLVVVFEVMKMENLVIVYKDGIIIGLVVEVGVVII